jgi:hypothetical protein
LSTTFVTLPMPSHTFLWQVPGVCMEVGVPAMVNVAPHTPAMHARFLQSVS